MKLMTMSKQIDGVLLVTEALSYGLFKGMSEVRS